MEVKVVGVIGAGEIGVGVVQNLAQTAHDVILLDLTEQKLERAKEALKANIRFHGLFKGAGEKVSVKDLLARITFTIVPASLESADFVIENVTEKWEVKRDVYTLIDDICPASAIFAVNTSAIPITRLASLTKRPAQVIGTHFMNPVPFKSTVEVIRGYYTSDETLERTRKLLASMGKECIVVGDSPGFVSNRVLI